MKIINIICISLFTSLLTMSIAHSDGHIKLEYFATAKLFLDPLAPVADRDIIANVPTEGSYIETADGERWNIHNPCADWLVLQASGVFNLDVRCSAKTEDGSAVRVDYIGRAYPANEIGSEKMTSSELITRDDFYFITAPHMKTVSEKYSWINNTMFVGEMVEMQFFNDKGKRPYVMYKWYAVK